VSEVEGPLVILSVANALAGAKAKGLNAGDAELPLAHVLERDRAWLIAHDDVEPSQEQQREFEALLARRAAGEPVAYLTGEVWFYGRRFEVTPAVLVPRPETEHLIDEALAFLRAMCEKNAARRPVVLDVGTGSGAVACTIAAELPNTQMYATDTSASAFEIARRNAAALSARIVFECADLMPSDATLRFDCVTANLPYIPTADVPRAPDPVSFEPREAVDGGPDGLREYRRLLATLPSRLSEGALVLLEAAPATISALRDLVSATFPGAHVSAERDYAGLERYVRVANQGLTDGRER
jgi:release factor glutamine methyltransferase